MKEQNMHEVVYKHYYS